MDQNDSSPGNPSGRDRWILPLGAFAASALWGSAFPSIKYAFTLMDQPDLSMRLAFAGIRFTMAGFLLSFFLAQPLSDFRRAHKGLLWGVTLLQVTLQYWLFYWGLALNSGIVSAIINATGSFWWLLLAPLFHGTPPPHGRQFVFLAVGFVGVCLAVLQGAGSGQVSLFGCGLLFISTIFATLATLMVRNLGQQVSSRFITSFALTVGGGLLLLAGASGLPRFLDQAGWQLWALTAYLALVSALAFTLWYYLVSRYDVTTLSGYRYMVPICGVVESALFLPDERLGWATALGGGLVVFSVWLLQRRS